MEFLRYFFDINSTLFTLLGYKMSYLEFAGTLLNLWCVWLVARDSILNWPVGNVAVILFAALFYQIQLYSDLVEQGYFLVTGFYGWWAWTRLRRRGESGQASASAITTNSPRANLAWGAGVVAGTILMGFVMGRIHLWLPAYFPEVATYVYMDAFTTVMSFAAQILMARKRIECWFLWIAVDVIGIWLYHAKGVVFVSLLYAIFLALATRGLIHWRRIRVAELRPAS